MKCRNHPESDAMAVCLKFNFAFCRECCENGNPEDSPLCYCTSPNVHCKYRSECVIYFKAGKKSRELKAKK